MRQQRMDIYKNQTYHFIYKTSSPSGKYYFGRHSTSNLNDGYYGSGKWVRSVKQKEKLTTEIIEYAPSFQELLLLEEKYLQEYVGKPNCMNFNKLSVGFPFGENRWWTGKTEIERFGSVERAKEISTKRIKSNFGKLSRPGKSNGMFGRSAVTENNLRWYNNGIIEIMVPEGTQPKDYVHGQFINHNAKSYIAISPTNIKYNITKGQLKQFCQKHNICFTGMKKLARTNSIGKRFSVKNWQCYYSR
jgi:hypothetical protein